MYVKNKLEDCDDLVEYYSTLCTKQPMENSNAELNECWELVEAQFFLNEKKIITHKRDEEGYKRYLLAFKKVFPNFIYKSSNNSKPNLVEEAKEIKSNRVAKEE